MEEMREMCKIINGVLLVLLYIFYVSSLVCDTNVLTLVQNP